MEEKEIIEERDSHDLDKFSNVARSVLSGTVAGHQVPKTEQLQLTDIHSCSPRAYMLFGVGHSWREGDQNADLATQAWTETFTLILSLILMTFVS